MADLLQEVDEAMRQERMMKIWKDNAPLIIAFVIGTLVLTGAFSAYKNWDAQQREQQTAELLTLQNAENYPENFLTADLSDMRGGLRAMGYLSAANIFMQDDRFDDALALYNKVGTDSKAPKELQALGSLMKARLAQSNENTDLDAIKAELKTVAASSSNPFAAHAHLELAVLLAAQNDLGKAQEHLNAVLDLPNLPETLYQRARNLNHLYALKAASANE